MNPLNKLASAQGRRDEIPNQELAQKIAQLGGEKAIEILIEALKTQSKDIQHDCIKTLYEVGVLEPKLISGYYQTFLNLLSHRNNRMQWGAMTALSTIVTEKPKEIFEALPQILNTAEKGTVVTRDHAVKILTALGKNEKYRSDVFPLLIEQVLNAPVNQLPNYAEQALPIAQLEEKEMLIRVVQQRLSDVAPWPAKTKRLEKVLRKLF